MPKYLVSVGTIIWADNRHNMGRHKLEYSFVNDNNSEWNLTEIVIISLQMPGQVNYLIIPVENFTYRTMKKEYLYMAYMILKCI